MTFHDLIGLIGACLFLVAYAGMQFEKLDPHRPPAMLMNFVGALLVLWSLVKDFNLASFFLESVWAVVALYGLAKWALRRSRQ